MVPAHYQVALMGPGASRHREGVVKSTRLRVKQIDRALVKFLRFLDGSTAVSFDPKAPFVGVYFGRPNPQADRDSVRQLLAFSAVVLPVVTDLSKFRKQVPTELHGINGVALRSTHEGLDSLINLILENLGLLRRTRRLFISYRRADSAQAAIQLRHELDARGYDVFLDTHSVPKGDQFQEVLWQRLADSDIMLLLDTPGFVSSRWTREELAQAHAMTIGVLQIVWPGNSPTPYTDLCERLYLRNTEVEATALVPSVVEEIAASTERLRARSLAARYDNLVREFCEAVHDFGGRSRVQPQRYVTAMLPSRRRIAAFPAVGVPDAPRYHEISEHISSGTHALSEAWLLYDHRGLRESWSRYLAWLDQYLPVKAVRITAVAEKLLAM